jgi:hypothetical protein
MVAGGARRLARGEAFTEVDPGADLIRTFDDERGMTRGGRLVTIGGVLTPLLIPTVISLVRARNTVDRVGELDLASDRVEECGRAPLAEEQLQLMADGAVLGASATNASGAAEFQLDPVRVPTALTWVAGETRGPVSQAVADAISAATRERADRISRERRAAQAEEYQAVVAREIENGRCSADSESILAPTISALGQQVRRDWVIDSHGVMIVTDHAFLVTGPTPTAHRLSPSLAGEYTVVARSRGAISIRVLTETGGQVSRGTDVGSTLVLNLGYEPHWAHGTFVSNGRDPYRLEITGQGCVLITLVYRP